MDYHKKIAFFCLFSWLIAAPLSVLAEPATGTRGITIMQKAAMVGSLYSQVLATAIACWACAESIQPKIPVAKKEKDLPTGFFFVSRLASAGLLYSASLLLNYCSETKK